MAERVGGKQQSRREFLKMMVGVTGATVLGRTLDLTTSTPEEPFFINRSQDKPNYTLVNSFPQTALQAFAEQALEYQIDSLSSKIGVYDYSQAEIATGSRIAKGEIPITHVCLIGPFSEEVIFRLVPSLVAGKNGMRWDYGTVSSILFAQSHNGKDALSVKHIQAGKTMGGLFCWYLMRKKGFAHVLFAHTLHNSVAMTARHYQIVGVLGIEPSVSTSRK